MSRNKDNVVVVGATPCVVKNGKFVPVKVENECGMTLKVETYGGGVRWYCPSCDRGSFGTMPSIVYTNSTPPQDMTCHRPRKYR